jgi:hypothetical protein
MRTAKLLNRITAGAVTSVSFSDLVARHVTGLDPSRV